MDDDREQQAALLRQDAALRVRLNQKLGAAAIDRKVLDAAFDVLAGDGHQELLTRSAFELRCVE